MEGEEKELGGAEWIPLTCIVTIAWLSMRQGPLLCDQLGSTTMCSG